MTETKVFGVGLSRTGTKSMSKALNKLGINNCHFPGFHFTHSRFEVREKALQEHQGLNDTPIALGFPQLDERFPGSRFIYTVRDMPSWLDSCRRFFAREKIVHRPHLDALHLRLYRATYFQEEPFRDAYIRHDQFVRNYFRNRPQDLLIFNVCAGESWERLAEFLDKPTPQEPFPRSRG